MLLPFLKRVIAAVFLRSFSTIHIECRRNSLLLSLASGILEECPGLQNLRNGRFEERLAKPAQFDESQTDMRIELEKASTILY